MKPLAPAVIVVMLALLLTGATAAPELLQTALNDLALHAETPVRLSHLDNH